MLDFISQVSNIVTTIFGELSTLFTYIDSYPVVYYILCLSVVIEVVMILKHLIRTQ